MSEWSVIRQVNAEMEHVEPCLARIHSDFLLGFTAIQVQEPASKGTLKVGIDNLDAHSAESVASLSSGG